VFPELLDVIKEGFSIDEDRVFVTGMSNGALEALLVSMHYPDLIAASAVVFGPFKVRFYKDNIENLNKSELEKFIDTLGYPQRMLTNLKNLPLYISHGGGDEAVPLDEGLVLHEIVKKLGAPSEFTSYPHYGHTWHMVDEDLPGVFNWFKRFKRNEFPRDINYTAPNAFLKNGIYWIDFSPFKIEDEIKIKATVNQDNRIKLELQNIKWIKMRLNSRLLRLPGVVYVETENSTQEMEILDEERDIELAF
jgi:predicted esterase